MPEGTAVHRPALPTRARDLPSMGAAFELAIERGLRELDLSDTPAASRQARDAYEHHARLLREWGAAMNLTAIREPAVVAERHVCDSLSAVTCLSEVSGGATLLDLGSGGGYPGLPLAAALPLAAVTLLDSVGKKARFLSVAAAAVTDALRAGGIEPPGIAALGERAEDVAEEPDRRGSWDIVTARAVGSLAEVVELGMPLLREGGRVLAWKRENERGGLGAELRDAGSIIRATGGGRPDVIGVTAASLADHRLVIIRKERPTPASYPRAPSRRPRRRPG